MTKLDEITANGSSEDKLESMLEFFQKEVMQTFREAQTSLVEQRMEEDVTEYKTMMMTEKLKVAENITNKYAVVSREYSKQNKGLNENHLKIVDEEQNKREQIRKNFDQHIEQVTAKIEEDENKENEVVKETKELQDKYEALCKEIEEKTKMMDDEIAKKQESSKTIQDQIVASINEKKTEMASQSQQYAQAIVMKSTEEQELVKILNDYREKFSGMEKALNKSRSTFKAYDKQLKALETQVKNLTQEKEKLAAPKKSNKKKKNK